MLEIVTIKIIVMVLMLFITFVASMCPLLFVRQIRRTTDANVRSKYESLLSLLSCFAGGVFMGTCILDLFPDVQAEIHTLLQDYPPSARAFPVAEFIVVYGFLIVLTLEQIVLWHKEQALETCADTERLLEEGGVAAAEHRRALREHSIEGITDRADLTASLRSHVSSMASYGATDDVFRESNDASYHQISYHHHHDGVDAEAHLHSPLRSLMLLFALSLHSVFEGLAVGLQDSIDDVVALFLIVIFHKGIISLSLGLNMVQSRLSLRQVVLGNSFFCVTAPVGIALGVGISSLQASPTTAFISGGLQGIACGTFLYVTFFEVLPHEMNNGHLRLWKVVFIVFGFTAVSAMMYIDPSHRTPESSTTRVTVAAAQGSQATRRVINNLL